MLYPAYAVIFSKGIEGFAKTDSRERRYDGDRNALWLFVIAILSSIAMGLQSCLFGYAASTLTARLRILSFKAVLRQDIEFFDQDKNSVSLISTLLFNTSKAYTLGFLDWDADCTTQRQPPEGERLGWYYPRSYRPERCHSHFRCYSWPGVPLEGRYRWSCVRSVSRFNGIYSSGTA